MGAGQEGNPGNQRGQDEGRKGWVGALKGLKEEVERGGVVSGGFSRLQFHESCP